MHVTHNQTERVIEFGGEPNLEIGEFPRIAAAVIGDPEMVLISPRSEIGFGHTHTSTQVGKYVSFLEGYRLNQRAWFGHVETLLM